VKFSRKQIDLQKASRDALTHSIDTIVNEFSRIDILVNNAGITRRGVPETMNEQDWCEVLDMNLTVPFYLSQAAAKHFIEQKSGKIINIASVLSFQGGINVPSYTASKHGLIGLTRSFAIRLARYGINVNAIAPGFMETDMNVPLIHDRERNVQILHRIPAGRWGQGRDLKGALILLASKASEFINGAIIPVDGGWLAG
jgi:2-deoxy-D-gluconate 3-dehydrogenase